MSKPLVSVMIPTRKRLERLWRTLDNLHKTASGDDYAILIRIDKDDEQSMAEYAKLSAMKNTKVFVGERLLGYGSLDIHFYAKLEEAAESPWVWIAGDDMIVTGDWLGELRKVPETGFIVQPEISKLGLSTYLLAEAQAFPIFPRFCWKPFSETFPKPFDTNGHMLLTQNGWKTWFLPGVTMWHQRPDEKELAEHRKMI